ncbi:MAG: hypothetical protein RBQ91_00355 [Acholeplasma sp.]|nr:hypothetical protein [Acholeplasma sp.]
MSRRKKPNKSSIQSFIVFIVFALLVFLVLNDDLKQVFTELANGLILVGAILLSIYFLINVMDHYFTKAKKRL